LHGIGLCQVSLACFFLTFQTGAATFYSLATGELLQSVEEERISSEDVPAAFSPFEQMQYRAAMSVLLRSALGRHVGGRLLTSIEFRQVRFGVFLPGSFVIRSITDTRQKLGYDTASTFGTSKKELCIHV